MATIGPNYVCLDEDVSNWWNMPAISRDFLLSIPYKPDISIQSERRSSYHWPKFQCFEN